MKLTTRRQSIKPIVTIVLIVLIVLAAMVPLLPIGTAGILPGPLSNPGSLQVLATIFVVTALAVSFDIPYGFAGMMSLGHAAYFAVGSYTFVLLMNETEVGFGVAFIWAFLASLVSGFVLNAIAGRTSHIGYAMVTLAFGQAIHIVIIRNIIGSTGGEAGLLLSSDHLPDMFVGVFNMKNVYWLSLVLLLGVVFFALWITQTRLGLVWQSTRENELRAKALGYNTYRYQVAAGTVGAALAGLCGIVYVIILGGTDPNSTGLFFSINLLVMVVLGGKGLVTGALVGGLLYNYLNQRLSAFSNLSFVDELPLPLKIVLEQPTAVLGIIFILIVLFLPGGIVRTIRDRTTPRLDRVLARH